jgi:hypothetical protein
VLFPVLLPYKQGACAMSISSPPFVIALIVLVFVVAILFATGSKEDGHSEH